MQLKNNEARTEFIREASQVIDLLSAEIDHKNPSYISKVIRRLRLIGSNRKKKD